MTGKNPDRIGITSPWCHLDAQEPTLADSGEPWEQTVLPEPRTYLPHEEYTLPEALGDAGYHTRFQGKWHLGKDPYGPESHGFEEAVGNVSVGWPPSYFSPYENENLEDGPRGEYLPHRLGREAAGYIEEHADSEDPFFLCHWTYSVHTPLEARPTDIEDFEATVDPRGTHDKPVMGAMIRGLDDAVGIILDALDRTGQVEDTVVVFTADHGTSTNAVDGHRHPSRPARGAKATLYDGGLRVPLIVRWPGTVDPQSVSREVVTSADLYPTIVEMAGETPREEQVTDGHSLVPILRDGVGIEREAIFCHYPHATDYEGHSLSADFDNYAPGTMVRTPRWKLIRRWDTNDHFPDEYELYDVRADVGESTNLAKTHPEKVAELDAMIDEYLADTPEELIPIPNPDFDPATSA